MGSKDKEGEDRKDVRMNSQRGMMTEGKLIEKECRSR